MEYTIGQFLATRNGLRTKFVDCNDLWEQVLQDNSNFLEVRA